jgi:hypothetical protein
MWARLLCFVGIHKWVPATPEKGQHCVRSPRCRYHGMEWRG